MKVEQNSVVSIQYKLTNGGGELLDQSQAGQPLVYIQGLGHLIPGLESEIQGKEKGQKFQVTVTPEKGYGERNDQMIQTVPKTEFENADQIQQGMQFQVETPQGPMFFTAIDVKENDIVLDGNHPLAGETLHFDVEIEDIRSATKEELDHGHVHGPGGHDH